MTVVSLINSVMGVVFHAPQAAHSAAAAVLGDLPGGLLAAVPALALLAGGDVLLARRALADRAAVEFLPGPGFNPSDEEVLRFAYHLSRAQASASRWHITPRRATAVRIRLTSSGGPPSFQVEARTRTLDLIRRHAYVGCELGEPGKQVTSASSAAIHFDGPEDGSAGAAE
jgi:hypothetical protein